MNIWNMHNHRRPEQAQGFTWRFCLRMKYIQDIMYHKYCEQIKAPITTFSVSGYYKIVSTLSG